MMKKAIFLILGAVFTSCSFAQFPVSTDSLYTFIKSNSVFRNTIDWTPVDITFKEEINKALSLRDTMNCFVSVLESLNDFHSQIYLNNQYYGNYPGYDDTTLAWIRPLNDKAILSTNMIRTATLAGQIAYIGVPAFQAFNTQEINFLAQSLYDSIDKFDSASVKGWIIDLRLNGGGNIYPMLAGLSSILGNNIVGYETDIFDSITRKWEIKNGNFMIGGYQATDIKARQKPKFQNNPVVVLIGPVTKSSGSMTGIAFKKRPATIFVGEPTADGYTTSNGYFQFAPNLTLNFATNFVADRELNIYKTRVSPDITVYHGDNFDDLSKDEKVKRAIQWISKNNIR
ncbi:MAG: S41 family peptidase [Bacteroidales bacterium]|nr:S41 family peptidase [Bacteroidales bacterium]